MPFVNIYGIMSASAGVYTLNIIKIPNSVFSITAENRNSCNKWRNKWTAIGLTCLIKIVTYYLLFKQLWWPDLKQKNHAKKGYTITLQYVPVLWPGRRIWCHVISSRTWWRHQPVTGMRSFCQGHMSLIAG